MLTFYIWNSKGTVRKGVGGQGAHRLLQNSTRVNSRLKSTKGFAVDSKPLKKVNEWLNLSVADVEAVVFTHCRCAVVYACAVALGAQCCWPVRMRQLAGDSCLLFLCPNTQMSRFALSGNEEFSGGHTAPGFLTGWHISRMASTLLDRKSSSNEISLFL